VDVRPEGSVQSRAQEIIRRLGGGLCRGFACADHLADGRQAGPARFVQPIDLAADCRRVGFDAAVIGVDGGCDGLGGRVVEIGADIVMQRVLVALQSQRVIAALIDDLLGDRALAVQRIGRHDGAFQRQHLQQRRHGGDFIGLGIGRNLSQHQALFAAPGTDHVQGGPTAGVIE
jgi:hypothetical protein